MTELDNTRQEISMPTSEECMKAKYELLIEIYSNRELTAIEIRNILNNLKTLHMGFPDFINTVSVSMKRLIRERLIEILIQHTKFHNKPMGSTFELIENVLAHCGDNGRPKN